MHTYYIHYIIYTRAYVVRFVKFFILRAQNLQERKIHLINFFQLSPFFSRKRTTTALMRDYYSTFKSTLSTWVKLFECFEAFFYAPKRRIIISFGRKSAFRIQNYVVWSIKKILFVFHDSYTQTVKLYDSFQRILIYTYIILYLFALPFCDKLSCECAVISSVIRLEKPSIVSRENSLRSVNFSKIKTGA